MSAATIPPVDPWRAPGEFGAAIAAAGLGAPTAEPHGQIPDADTLRATTGATDLLTAALTYAAAGCPVFPCRPDKRPVCAGGFKDAVTDRKQVETWWTARPGMLIGRPTGAVSGVIVLDVDMDATQGKDGEASLSALTAQHGPLPDTWEVLTPRGGRHLYFRHPGGHLPNSASKLGPDLDIRGDGGYVIAPPSRLPDGRSYQWEASSDPEEGAPLADLPGWLLALIVSPPSQQAPSATSADGMCIDAGRRNDSLFRLGRSLRAKGLTAGGIEAALLAENAARCDPPLSDAEVRIIAASAARPAPGHSAEFDAQRPSTESPPPPEPGDPGPGADSQGRPGERGERGEKPHGRKPEQGANAAPWPDPRLLPARGTTGEAAAFPMHLLPAPIQTAAREVARFVKAPEAAPALVGLATLATAIGKRARVEERPGLTHYPALFFAGIAATGERKSAVFKPMTAPLEDWSADQGPAWEENTRKAKARNTAIDAALTDAKSKAKKGGVDAAERSIAELEAQRLTPPPAPRLFTSDPTEQRLFQMMHDRGGAFAVLSGEGRPVIDAIAGKYSGEGRTGDAIYLAGISGDTITRDRVGGEGGPEDRVIRTPCLNVCILVQPDKYLEAAQHPALRASGALARIWPVWLPSMVGSRFEEAGEAGLDRGAMDPYAAMVRRLLNHTPPEDDKGRPVPHLATLSPAAAESRRLYHNAVEGLQGVDEDLADCREIASKAATQTVKLALVLHLAARPDVLDTTSSMIDAATWKAAEAIGAWFLTEAVRVQRQADEDPTLEAARRVLRWLATERRKSVTGRELQREGPRPRPDAKDAAAVLDLLTDHGYLREYTPDGAHKPGYLVHPALLVASVASVAGGSI